MTMSEQEQLLMKKNYQLSFRVMTDDDIDRMETIQKACYEHPWDSSVIAQVVDDSPNMHGRVLEKDNLVIGSCLFQKFDGQIYVADFNIAPEFQRRGFGKYMMQQLKKMWRS